jgi:polysaccharide biosynthesis protein PelD
VQHGALAAAVSSVLLAGVGVIHGLLGGALWPAALWPATLPSTTMSPAALASFAGGCLSAGVVAGHFRDRAQARLVRLSREARDGARRLARLARVHAVVKRSHQKLEERLAARSWSLVSAFDDARRTFAAQSSLAGVGEVALHVLSNHALVQSATLLTLGRDGTGRVALQAQARIGNPPPVDIAHPLVQRALDTGRLVALDAESADGGGEQDLLAVAPLGTASGRLLGLVLVHEMPFMAFQAENLKGLAALTALLADMLEDRFVEGHPEDALHLSLLPERALRAVAPPSSEAREKDERDDRPTEEWLEDELAASEMELPAEAGPDGEFVGSRTGTHRRRGVAQSA